MPPFSGLSQLRNAIQGQALPILEQLASSQDRLEESLNKRFERDEPPPYVSSSEDEEEEALRHPVLALSHEATIERFRDLVSKPLNDVEIEGVVYDLCFYNPSTPGVRYNIEARREHDRLDTFWAVTYRHSHAEDRLKGPRGHQRRDVIVRRNIRKRWQRLGIWNPEWGIPGRVNGQPNGNVSNWKWKWQPSTDLPPSDPQHPINRAVQLRRNLAYGDHAPPPPHSHLRHDAAASEAESFITSRPWFIYAVERAEFYRRFSDRIPVEQWGREHPDEDNQVTKWWKERGDWMPGWKWRHESPSPEPEDLTPLDTDDMDFTPSEVDALEAIPPPSPTPEPRWVPRPPGGLFGIWKPADAFEDAHSSAADEPEDNLVRDVQEQPPSPPPRSLPVTYSYGETEMRKPQSRNTPLEVVKFFAITVVSNSCQR